MSQTFVVGQRYPLTQEDVDAMIRLSGTVLTGILIGQIDLSRGRLLMKEPGEWKLWNTEGRAVNATINPHTGIFISVEKDPDPNLPEPLMPPTI